YTALSRGLGDVYKRQFLFAAFVFIPFLPASAEACSCRASFTPWLAELSDSNAVFVGKVRSVVKVDPDDDGFGFVTPDRRVTFEIEKTYKGLDASIRLVSMYADYERTSCSFAVDDRKGPRVGEKWIVFASEMDTRGEMFFGGSCNASRKLNSTKQLASIEDGFNRLKGRQGIAGSIVLNYTKLATNFEVEIAGEGLKQRSKADADGYYWFPLEKPGRYTIRVILPFKTELFNAYNYPKSVESSPSATTIVYEVELRDGQFHYNEFNVSEPETE
ncbi:MAG: carboxypeptidase-like regulatory domain-containing protein, partial [Pyrinomonadaceae bacterium]|nr:carboxypeptidase-like regulatory domain-containing protein [Pyrinomonadaceae bacterium]